MHKSDIELNCKILIEKTKKKNCLIIDGRVLWCYCSLADSLPVDCHMQRELHNIWFAMKTNEKILSGKVNVITIISTLEKVLNIKTNINKGPEQANGSS